MTERTRTQRKKATEREAAPQIVNDVLASDGQPLDDATRAFMEPRFGHDFGAVRVHTDSQAAESAEAVSARAYTVGSDVVFGEGEYAPGSSEGQRLIAHELTHVVQFSTTTSTPDFRHISPSDHLSESQARAISAGRTNHSLMIQPIGIALQEKGSDQQQQIASDHDVETPEMLIEKYTNWGGLNLREEDLATDLLRRLPQQVAFVSRVFDILRSSDRDDVAFEIAHQATDRHIQAIATSAGGRELIRYLIQEMQAGWTTGGVGAAEEGTEAYEVERLIRLSSPDHARLRAETWANNPAIIGALNTSGSEMQSINSGSAEGDYIYDEYSIIIEEMPPNLTPEAYLSEMAADLNTTVNNEMFTRLNEFKRVNTSPKPEIGDIYHIDIGGPVNGSVMLVERTLSHFIFQTIYTKQDGYHPEYGSRQFGFERQSDDSVMFYTRGASRPGFAGWFSRIPQDSSWNSLMEGIAASIVTRHGRVRFGSLRSWTTHRSDFGGSETP